MQTPKIDYRALAERGGYKDPKTGKVVVNTPEQAKLAEAIFDRPDREEAT